MARKYIGCTEVRQRTGQKCTVAMSADTTEELIEAAADHGVRMHGHEDTPEFRENIRSAIKEEEPCP